MYNLLQSHDGINPSGAAEPFLLKKVVLLRTFCDHLSGSFFRSHVSVNLIGAVFVVWFYGFIEPRKVNSLVFCFNISLDDF